MRRGTAMHIGTKIAQSVLKFGMVVVACIPLVVRPTGSTGERVLLWLLAVGVIVAYSAIWRDFKGLSTIIVWLLFALTAYVNLWWRSTSAIGDGETFLLFTMTAIAIFIDTRLPPHWPAREA